MGQPAATQLRYKDMPCQISEAKWRLEDIHKSEKWRGKGIECGQGII